MFSVCMIYIVDLQGYIVVGMFLYIQKQLKGIVYNEKSITFALVNDN